MISPNGIRAVFFDLDGTLRHNDPSPEKTFLDYAVQLGVPDSVELRRRVLRWVHYYWAQSEELLQDRQTFLNSEIDFWLNYTRSQLVAFECPPDQLEEILPLIFSHMKDQYRPQDRLIKGVPETLQALKEAGFQLGVVSNRTNPYQDELQRLELEGYFDLVVAAGEVQSWKPNPGIFIHALQKLELGAGETIYVGDNYFADVVGARRAGLQPVLLDPDGLFPDAGCPVLESIPQLLDLLEEHQPQTGSYTRSDR
jgi:HAD superfamily hydrolase (TIGR01549 family)